MHTPTFPDRLREHEAPHVRFPELQALDALLRIEELLVKMLGELAGLKLAPEPMIVDMETAEALKSGEANKPDAIIPVKKRNPRQL